MNGEMKRISKRVFANDEAIKYWKNIDAGAKRAFLKAIKQAVKEQGK